MGPIVVELRLQKQRRQDPVRFLLRVTWRMQKILHVKRHEARQGWLRCGRRCHRQNQADGGDPSMSHGSAGSLQSVAREVRVGQPNAET